MTRWTWALLLAALAFMMSPGAGAHTQLERAVPAAGSVVGLPPSTVTLWFSERIEPAFSKIQVLSPTGLQVDKGDSQVDPADAKRISVSLSRLEPGTYRVQWRVLSLDSHVNEDHFTFEVRP